MADEPVTPTRPARTACRAASVWDPHVFVSIDPSGTVTIVTHRSEMGTGSRTSLPMVVADEMEADWSRVKIVQAPGNEQKYGNQDTDGSRSIRHFIQPMRACGAATRQMLEHAAAHHLGCFRCGMPRAEPQSRPCPDRQVAGLSANSLRPPPRCKRPSAENLTLKDPSQFRYIGKGQVQITDLFNITTGKAKYAQDINVPGMKFAVVARPPVVLGKVRRSTKRPP